MLKFSSLGAVVACGLFVLVAAEPAQAQAIRTWVSGVGDDANPCSRTAPCKTFPGAISKTAAGGEIDVLDPGSFSTVTITKSITIDGSGGSIAGSTASAVNGMSINDSGAGTAVVTLRNLSIFGEGFNTVGAAPGVRGVSFVSGAVLNIQHCLIREFRDATNGAGISFTPAAPATLNVNDTIVTGNGTLGADGGIVIKPTGSGSATVAINGSQVQNNSAGIRADSSGTTGFVRGTVRDTVVSGSSFNGISAVAGTGVATLMLEDDSVSGNLNGLVVNGANSSLYANRVNVAGNGTGLLQTTPGVGHLFTYKTNAVNNNTTADGAFTDTLVPE